MSGSLGRLLGSSARLRLAAAQVLAQGRGQPLFPAAGFAGFLVVAAARHAPI